MILVDSYNKKSLQITTSIYQSLDFNISSEAFSPIMIVGAFVFPETIFGIIDASATRKFFIPCTCSFELTTERLSLPILQVLVGW